MMQKEEIIMEGVGRAETHTHTHRAPQRVRSEWLQSEVHREQVGARWKP